MSKIKFKESMIKDINNSPIWTMLEYNYDKYYITEQTDINIPKKIHQIWLGGDIPDKYRRLISTWREKNPDWEYRLWTDSDIENFGLSNIDKFNSISNLGAKSDIFRYEILYRHGGLYIDTDFECLSSFDDLLYLDFFAGTGHVSSPEVFNGLIACKPEHSLIKKLIDDIKVVQTEDWDEILSLTGPKYFSNKLFNYINEHLDEKIVVFPTPFFYPFPMHYRHMTKIDNIESQNIVKQFNTNESHCTHLWYTSWQK